MLAIVWIEVQCWMKFSYLDDVDESYMGWLPLAITIRGPILPPRIIIIGLLYFCYILQFRTFKLTFSFIFVFIKLHSLCFLRRNFKENSYKLQSYYNSKLLYALTKMSLGIHECPALLTSSKIIFKCNLIF